MHPSDNGDRIERHTGRVIGRLGTGRPPRSWGVHTPNVVDVEFRNRRALRMRPTTWQRVSAKNGESLPHISRSIEAAT